VIAKTVTVSGTGVSLGGADGANYTLTNAATIGSTTATITPKALTYSGITAADKVYDGTTTATISSANAAITGTVAGDNVNVSTQAASANFASKDVALNGTTVTSQTVTVSGLSLGGTDAGNYSASGQTQTTASILQRALSITGSVAQDKTTDTTTTATVTPGQLGNLVAGEALVVTATGQFDTADVGANKAVTTQYAVANGNNGIATNYIAPTTEVLRAAILASNALPNPVPPVINPVAPTNTSRVAVSAAGAGFALAGAENAEVCSVENPENCNCETAESGVEICYAPATAAPADAPAPAAKPESASPLASIGAPLASFASIGTSFASKN